MTRPGRPILIAAQLSPPSSLVAARRVAGLVKYLAGLGHELTVLTSLASGRGRIPGAARVVRTQDLLASPLNWRRGHLDALTGGVGSHYGRPSRLEAWVVPDLALMGWLPFALPRAMALARAESFDCVVTTSPPQSAHLIGLALRRRGLRWIAEFRDGWTFEPPHRPWPLRAQRALDGALERAIVQRADAVVGVTAPIVADLESRFGARALLITNGFDPEELRISPDGDPLLDGSRHSFVHTGRMGSAGSTPAPLLEALRSLTADSPEIAARLEVVFAGPLSEEESSLVRANDLKGVVKAVGFLERQRALALQAAADTLLVVTEGSRRRSVATGKLFEYLGAGKPILVLGEETEAARIVSEAGAGIATSADDPAAIAGALRRLLEAPGAGAPPAAVERFSYPSIAQSFGELVDDVCSR